MVFAYYPTCRHICIYYILFFYHKPNLQPILTSTSNPVHKVVLLRCGLCHQALLRKRLTGATSLGSDIAETLTKTWQVMFFHIDDIHSHMAMGENPGKFSQNRWDLLMFIPPKYGGILPRPISKWVKMTEFWSNLARSKCESVEINTGSRIAHKFKKDPKIIKDQTSLSPIKS